MRESRVDHSGRFFMLALAPEADCAGILRSALEVLADARRPGTRVETELIESYRRGARWMRAGETAELSREEAHILAARRANEAARSVGLDAARTQKLLRILDEELAAAFDHIHAAGGGLGPKARGEFESAAQRTIERSRTFLSEVEVLRLEEYVTRSLAN